MWTILEVLLALAALLGGVALITAAIATPPPTPGDLAAEDQYRAEAEGAGW